MYRLLILTAIIFGFAAADSADAQTIWRGRILRAQPLPNAVMPQPIQRLNQFSVQSSRFNRIVRPGYGPQFATQQRAAVTTMGRQPCVTAPSSSPSPGMIGDYRRPSSQTGPFNPYRGEGIYPPGYYRMYSQSRAGQPYPIRTTQGVVYNPNLQPAPARGQIRMTPSVMLANPPAGMLNSRLMAPTLATPASAIPTAVRSSANSVAPVSNNQSAANRVEVQTVDPVSGNEAAPAKSPELSGPINNAPTPKSSTPGAQSVLEPRKK